MARVNSRRALVMADQGVSSLSNVVVSIFVARASSGDDFGAFGVAIVVFLLVQGAARALIGEPLLSRYSSAEADTRRSLVPDMLGATLTISAVAALAVGVVAGLAGGAAGSALLALALVLPLLLVQDTWRYVFIVDRPGAALVTDVVWLAVVCVVLAMAPAGASPAWFVAAWGASGGLGALAGLVLHHGSVGRPHPARWLTGNRDMGTRFLGEFATGQAVGQIVLAGVGVVSGLGVIGAVRAAQLFYGPLNTVHQGIYLALVPEGARSADAAQLRRLMVKASVALVMLAGVWLCVGLVLPTSWGEALFGDTWAEASDLILPMGLAMVAGSAATGGFAGVRALGAAKESLRARLRTVAPQLTLPLGGASLGAGPGYAIGFGLGHLASAVIWWGAFARALASHPGTMRVDGRHDGSAGSPDRPNDDPTGPSMSPVAPRAAGPARA